jgi:hypothetical protein
LFTREKPQVETVAQRVENQHMLRRVYRHAKFLTLAGTFFAVLVLAFTTSAQTAKPAPSQTPQPHQEVHRWFDLEALTLSTRYRYIDNAVGRTVSNQQQWQILGRGRFKFDRRAKYSAVLQIETGRGFTAGWNNTGWGTGDLETNVFTKHLYFDAKPVKPIEVQLGGIALNNGENTEITGYDNDAYLTGERVAVRAPKQLWFDEISATSGYIGDFNRPDVFLRLRHLDRSNYHQFLVRKKINKAVGFSADYTFDEGTDMLRQAVRVAMPKLKFVDSLLYENYQRLDPQPGYGFALTGSKHVTPKLDLTGGITKISHVMFNSDRYPRGERLYFITSYKLTREFTLSPVIIRAVGPLPTPASHRTRFEFIASYNILEAFHHYHVF